MDIQIDNRDKDKRKLDKSIIPWMVLGVIIVVIAGFTLWSSINPIAETTSPIISGSVPDFNLTNQQGNPVGITDLEGKVWVADFIFTNCPTICPVMTQEMVKLQSEFDNEPVIFVSFTVDPQRDTPDVLSRYAVKFGADKNRWHFLTGEKDQIYNLANKGFKLAAAHHEGVFPHSSKFVLVRPDRNLHGFYDSRNPSAMKNLRMDVKKLLKDEENN